jgi:1-acyl-sn-glycerol-3-phosphate acyltransferase
LLAAVGIRVKIIGELPRPEDGPFVFTPNHRNFLDVLRMAVGWKSGGLEIKSIHG